MNIAIESLKRVEVLTLTGRVDSSTAGQLDQTIKELHDQDRSKLVIDLAGVEYLSSAGLRALITAHKNGKLALVSPSAKIQEVFKLAGLTSYFVIFNDKTAAVGSF